MKAKYLSMAALALMGALASCQSDDDFTVARPDNAVSVNFSVGSLQGTTRSNAATTDADLQKQFNAGDQISVSTNEQEAVIFQCTSTENQTWTEATAGKFLLWTQSTLTFSAYYPATTGTSMTAFTLPADQSSEAKIALADYMTRQQNISRPEGGSDIQMQLERKMARVIVRISGFGSQYFDDQKTVSNVRIYSESSGIADGNPTGSSTEIQPYAQGDDGQGSTYTALVVPGSGDSGARFIQLTDGEGSTLLVKGIPELNAGKSYTFNLTVGKNTIQVQSVTVTDWTTGETLAGGQATEQAAGAEGHALSASVVGEIVGTDGKAYAVADKDNLPTGVTAVAIVAYKSGSNGLAIALVDEGSMNWATAKSTCEGKTAIGGNSWKLPTLDEWKQMFIANGGSEYSQSGLNTALAAAGGDNSKLKEGRYWTLTEVASGAWNLEVGDGDIYWSSHDKSESYPVRACLAFTEGSAATLVTAITLNKTATTISAGNTETLSVSSVTPDNATDQTVTWSSDNEAVATVNATTGEVTAIALGTANITATANDGSGVTATCAVTVNKVVTINQSDWGWDTSFTKDGVTVSAGMIDPMDGNLMDGGTFSTTLGNFTKIVVTTQDYDASGTGWSGGTWAGTPASTVSFSGNFMGMGLTQTTIVCTIAPTN